jgi:hypothetical protein
MPACTSLDTYAFHPSPPSPSLPGGQASRAELLAGLSSLRGVQLGGVWRLVDPGYLGSLLELVLVW